MNCIVTLFVVVFNHLGVGLSCDQTQRQDIFFGRDCISKDILAGIVSKHCNGQFEIIDSKISEVVAVGENYLSKILRIEVRFTSNAGKKIESIFLIAKCPLENDLATQINEEINFYDREIEMYREILPLFAKQDYTMKMAPKLWSDSKKILIFEDLTSLNYKMKNRLEGLNLEHCLLVVEKLAYFHASSIKLYEKNPEVINRFDNEVLSSTGSTAAVDSTIMQGILDLCKNTPGLQKYASKINKNLNEIVYEATKPDPFFNVLNHGDLWSNNMLFRYDVDGCLDDVLFIDYQLSMFTTPVFDLHYFLVTSTNLEVKKKYLKVIFTHYCDALAKNAKLLKVETKIPNRRDLDKIFSEKACLGLGAMCYVLPVMITKQNENASLQELTQNDTKGGFRDGCFDNSYFKCTFQCLLAFYERLGVFDEET